jgi:hypothetical protein
MSQRIPIKKIYENSHFQESYMQPLSLVFSDVPPKFRPITPRLIVTAKLQAFAVSFLISKQTVRVLGPD